MRAISMVSPHILISINFVFHFAEDEAAEAEGCSSNGRAVAEGCGGENEDRIVSEQNIIVDICIKNPLQGRKGGKQYRF